ncbi:hypothetical protein OMO38_20165 [Chryseobacterium sp. 09-1422]|uniref:Uncharacterized protein n=1 Tax=Chryseobacterium kimseyorum TaxID=2984028 RepID=A0ABT3I4A7_9FLAO|nr:hypothetical protein [Chryseobacterium kimseyorum]MCW3170848.1 hypothetical protein [Chryseobacterium kimseyorum]
MITNLINLFKDSNIISHIDNFRQYEFIAITQDKESIIQVNIDLYQSINDIINEIGYNWSFEVEEIEYKIDTNGFEVVDIEDLNEFESFTVIFKIFKSSSNILIFDEEIFFRNLERMDLKSILLVLAEITTPIVIRNTFTTLSVSTNIIGYNGIPSQFESNQISIQCLFYNYSEIKFSPENFKLVTDGEGDRFLNIINKLYLVYILIYLFDVSEIKDDEIYLKIKGSKTFEYNIKFQDLNLSSLQEYKKIYEWTYTEKEKVEDKLGIVRNILGFYITKDSLEIDTRAFPSILSSNQLYIKGNLSKYLDSRTKIFEQVESVTNKINTSLDTFLSNFQKSVFVFISFYLTVFILKFFGKSDPATALNKEATLVGLFLLILSVIYMIFSLVILNGDRNRIKDKYYLIKTRFYDILNVDDVNKILNNDNEFENDITYFKKKRCRYLTIWVLSILILICILFSTSDYINFRYLISQK